VLGSSGVLERSVSRQEVPRSAEWDDPEDLGVELYSAPLKQREQSRNTLIEVDDLPAPGFDGPEPHDREFFVAPIPFRDSQIGFGLAVMGGVVFPLDDDPDTPPSMVALAGMYSENDSHGGFGLGHLHTRGDRWRIDFGGGSALSNYESYGIGSEPSNNGNSLPFETS
jgi:hypothetical protein